MTEVVVITHPQQTNTQLFTGGDDLPVAQPSVKTLKETVKNDGPIKKTEKTSGPDDFSSHLVVLQPAIWSVVFQYCIFHHLTNNYYSYYFLLFLTSYFSSDYSRLGWDLHTGFQTVDNNKN